MEHKHAIDEINAHDFDTLLKQYASIVPERLADLEVERLKTIPELLATRKQADNAYLTKAEVSTLVDWKLAHGTFRPTLKALVRQNDDKTVEDVTREGFATLVESNVEPQEIKKSIGVLTRMRGIGPATATLLLSCYDSDRIPFFSDELFRWCFWEDKPGHHWDRTIKYTLKEYLEMLAIVDETRQRFKQHFEKDVSALDLEKVAYVLGKRGQGIFADGNDSNTVDRDAARIKDDSTPGKRKADAIEESDLSLKAAQEGAPTKKVAKATKAKASSEAVPAAAVRRSTRGKVG